MDGATTWMELLHGGSYYLEGAITWMELLHGESYYMEGEISKGFLKPSKISGYILNPDTEFLQPSARRKSSIINPDKSPVTRNKRVKALPKVTPNRIPKLALNGMRSQIRHARPFDFKK